MPEPVRPMLPRERVAAAFGFRPSDKVPEAIALWKGGAAHEEFLGRSFGWCVIGCSNQIVAATPERNLSSMMETMDRHR